MKKNVLMLSVMLTSLSLVNASNIPSPKDPVGEVVMSTSVSTQPIVEVKSIDGYVESLSSKNPNMVSHSKKLIKEALSAVDSEKQDAVASAAEKLITPTMTGFSIKMVIEALSAVDSEKLDTVVNTVKPKVEDHHTGAKVKSLIEKALQDLAKDSAVSSPEDSATENPEPAASSSKDPVQDQAEPAASSSNA